MGCCNCFSKKKQPDPSVTSRRINNPIRRHLIAPDKVGRSDPIRRPLITPDADVRYLEYSILDSKHLDSRLDYDFTNVADDGTKHMRGGYPYNRPYGWKIVGLKVISKYNNDNWLVDYGSMNGQWAITYHGTGKECFKPICEQGYKIGPGDCYGKGVYSSPNINVALRYSKVFTYKGVAYKGVFQNRVNPNRVNIVNGNIWVCSNPEDIRPYALCIRKYNN